MITAYGAGRVAAGAFPADPVPGVPAGTPDGGSVSWHGVAHIAAGAVGFLCLVAACLLSGRRFAAAGRTGWAWFSRATGFAVLAGFVAVSTAASGTVIAICASVILAWTWLTALAADRVRRTRPTR
jgi:hypothetical protein